jgi:hypothetical protein
MRGYILIVFGIAVGESCNKLLGAKVLWVTQISTLFFIER